jgi:delta8-fatty-acid desaturase
MFYVINALNVIENRYHSDAALKTMTAYRIGRKQAGSWANRTPPTRGGVYHKQATSSVIGIDSDTEVDDGISLASSECSCEGPVHIRKRVLRTEAEVSDGVQTNDHCPSEQGLNQSHHGSSLSRTQFTNERIQSHAGLDAQQYPSLDPEVQQEIVRKYRVLHQKIRDDGLYNCPYLDYGKEVVRYAALFAAFLVALRFGQYIISAIFLGLFWVRFCRTTSPRFIS